MAGKINDTLSLYRARRKACRAAKDADMAKAVAALAPRSAAGKKSKHVDPPQDDPPQGDPPTGEDAGLGSGLGNDPAEADEGANTGDPAAPRG